MPFYGMVATSILYGILIGILVSAPMGPIGILCIRRTLHRGRRDGFYTGIGAILSDLFYATVTYLGIGLVMNFIDSNEAWLQLLGSVVMFLFGIYLYRTAPTFKVDDKDNNYSVWHTVLSSFGLTLSNPFIIFFFIALYSRFNFVTDVPGRMLVGYTSGMLGIALGAIGWWSLITYLFSLLRNRINVVGIRWFNRIVAVIFMAISGFGLFAGLSDIMK